MGSFLDKWSLPIGAWMTRNDSTKLVSRINLHPTVLLHFAVQFFNGIIQHGKSDNYLWYIFILYFLVFIPVLLVHQLAQIWVMARFLVDTDVILPTTLSIRLWGPHQQPATPNLDIERGLGFVGPAVHLAWTLIFLILYLMFDGFSFDRTFNNGVDYQELEANFGNVLVNVWAQAMWLNFTLLMMHLFLTAYPLSATILWSSWVCGTFSRESLTGTIVMEAWSALICAALSIVALTQTIRDDDNGIGIFMMFVFPALLVPTVKRMIDLSKHGPHTHVIWTRPCYLRSGDGDLDLSERENEEEEGFKGEAEDGVIYP